MEEVRQHSEERPVGGQGGGFAAVSSPEIKKNNDEGEEEEEDQEEVGHGRGRVWVEFNCFPQQRNGRYQRLLHISIIMFI